MSRLSRILNAALIAFLLAFAVVSAVHAQGEGGSQTDLSQVFAPILAAAAAIERFLQLIRNLISPDPEKGPLARDSKALRYYTTIGGVVLGLAMAFLSPNLKILALAGIAFDPLLDQIITGVTVGMGTEFIHEIIKIIAEGKGAFRAIGARAR